MAADANVTAFVANVAEISPSIVTTATNVLGLLLEPPLVIFVGVAFVFAGAKLGMLIWRKLRH
jgi:hypothetical protein